MSMEVSAIIFSLAWKVQRCSLITEFGDTILVVFSLITMKPLPMAAFNKLKFNN